MAGTPAFETMVSGSHALHWDLHARARLVFARFDKRVVGEGGFIFTQVTQRAVSPGDRRIVMSARR